MKIILNGKVSEVQRETSIENLLNNIGLNKEGVVTLLNENIIQREIRAGTILAENDSLEIISFVSGG